MALKNSSLFNFGLQITPKNQYISFGTTVLETGLSARLAVLQLGYYSLSSLAVEIVRAFTAADPLHIYTMSIDRTIAGGLQNRTTLSTTNTFLSIFFGTGNPSNPASLLGFPLTDLTGATTYTGSGSSGTAFIPNLTLSNTAVNGYSYLSPTTMQKLFGSVNISSAGDKEAIVFSLQSFFQVQYKYILESTLDSQWLGFVQWLIKQRQIEFTPDVTAPSKFFAGTLDNPAQGLEFNFSEMLPDFPGQFSTPLMKFRVSNS